MHREYAVLILLPSTFSMAWNEIEKAIVYTEQMQVSSGIFHMVYQERALHNLLLNNRPFSYFQDWNAAR